MTEEFAMIPINQLVYSGRNPRQEMRGIEEFAENVRHYGILEPVIVRPREGKFEVVVGERRIRAAVKGGLREVPAIIRALTDSQSDELRLIENIHRNDLTGSERGDAIYALWENYPERYPTLKSISDTLNISYSTLLQWARLSRRLSEFVRDGLSALQLSERAAQALMKYGHSAQDRLAKAIMRNDLKDEQVRIFLKLYDENPKADLDDVALLAKGVKKTTKLVPTEGREKVRRALENKPPVADVSKKISKSLKKMAEQRRAREKAAGMIPEDVKRAVQERPELVDYVRELSTIEELGRRRRLIKETIKRFDAVKKEAIKERLKKFKEKSEAMGAKFAKLEELQKRGLILHTIWDFRYRDDYAGDKDFVSNCSPQIVEQCILRFTNKGDLIVDPMAGSGTALDVCETFGRKYIGYDIKPDRSDIIQNDSRKLPLKNNSADMIFIHPPYWNLYEYTQKEENLPDLSRAQTLKEYLNMLGEVFRECYRVLKPEKYMCVLLGDLVKEGRFIPLCRKAANLAERIGFTDCGYAVKLAHGEVSRKKSGVIFAELAYTNNLKISHDLVMRFKKS